MTTVATTTNTTRMMIKVIKYFLCIIKSQLGTPEAAIARWGEVVQTHKSDRAVARDIVVARFPLWCMPSISFGGDWGCASGTSVSFIFSFSLLCYNLRTSQPLSRLGISGASIFCVFVCACVPLLYRLVSVFLVSSYLQIAGVILLKSCISFSVIINMIGHSVLLNNRYQLAFASAPLADAEFVTVA